MSDRERPCRQCKKSWPIEVYTTRGAMCPECKRAWWRKSQGLIRINEERKRSREENLVFSREGGRRRF